MSTEQNDREIALISLLRSLARSKRSMRASSLLTRVKKRHPEIEMQTIREVLWSAMNAGQIHAGPEWRMELTYLGKEFLKKADRR